MPQAQVKRRHRRVANDLSSEALVALISTVNGKASGPVRRETSYTKHKDRITDMWLDFRKAVAKPDEPEPDREDPFPQVPSKCMIQGFLKYCLMVGIGQYGPQVTKSTLSKHFVRLMACIRDKHGHNAIPPPLTRDITLYIGKALVDEGASLCARPKLLAGADVIMDIVHFLWALDEHDYPHPRQRLQLVTLLLLLLFTGVRPMELVHSSARSCKIIVSGIRCKDLRLAVEHHGGKRRYVAQLHINRKGGNGEAMKALTFSLVDDNLRRNACPVALLIALALSDGALQDVTKDEDLRSLQVKPGTRRRIIEIATAKKDVPIFRAPGGKDQDMSAGEMLDGNQLINLVSGVAARAGYKDRVTPYNIRRAHGAVLDRSVSSAVRQKQMGHHDAGTFQFYLSNHSAVDGQSMMLRREAEQDILDFQQSVAGSLDVYSIGRGKKAYHGQNPSKTPPCDENKVSYATGLDDHDGDHDEEDVEMAREPVPVVRRPGPTQHHIAYLKWDTARARVTDQFYPVQELELSSAVEALLELARPEQPSHWVYPTPAKLTAIAMLPTSKDNIADKFYVEVLSSGSRSAFFVLATGTGGRSRG